MCGELLKQLFDIMFELVGVLNCSIECIKKFHGPNQVFKWDFVLSKNKLN